MGRFRCVPCSFVRKRVASTRLHWRRRCGTGACLELDLAQRERPGVEIQTTTPCVVVRAEDPDIKFQSPALQLLLQLDDIRVERVDDPCYVRTGEFMNCQPNDRCLLLTRIVNDVPGGVVAGLEGLSPDRTVANRLRGAHRTFPFSNWVPP